MWSLLDLIDAPPPITVVDIGAALDERPAYQGLIERGAARLVGFEPDSKECERLNAAYGQPHRFFPVFVGDGRDAVFHETNWNLTGSLFEPNHELNQRFYRLAELVTLVARHPVKTTRLDDIGEIDDVDLIKIDVQGAELMVFQNAPRLLGRALMVQTEVEFVPLYREQPLFADVDIFLRQSGFQFHTFKDGFGSRSFRPLCRAQDPNAGFQQILWSDAVYVRDWMRFDLIDTEKLLKYAILCHDLLASYDLAMAIIERIDERTGGELAIRYRKRLMG